jgi:hypothetical protein
MRRMPLAVCVVALVAAARLVSAPQAQPFFPVGDLRPGMVGVGRTVFAGDAIDEFQVHVLGVLRNITGPKRDLILVRLEGGPLAKTGVIQGMSGSPVYIDGRLVGAVSYALGSFPKEALAGVTPIGEMMDAIGSNAPRGGTADLALSWPATPAQVYGALERLARRAAAPLGGLDTPSAVQGPASLASLAPSLRPIGAAMVFSGFDPTVDRDLRRSFSVGPAGQSPASSAAPSSTPLRPGDPVGVGFIRGDFEMGATGTVTHVDGSRVYAFGHPFLNLGPASLALTRAQVYTVIPSLDSSMKVAVLGPVIGTMNQDRATGIGGTIGAGPRELTVNLTLAASRGSERRLQFKVLHDQALTPLFAYVAVLNSLVSFERQSGALSIAASGTVSFGDNSTVVIDDAFSGDGVVTATAAAATAAIGMAATNEFRPALAETLDLTLRVSERTETTTIERAWLDTNRPLAGAAHTLQILVRDYRGATETVSMPVTMPALPGPVTLLVSDAPTLTALEERDLRPGRPTSWPDLVTRMNTVRRNNRLYVRLISSGTGTVVSGTALPALPTSVRSILDDDKTVATAPVARSVIGAWETRLTRVVRGSRELNLVVTAR